MEPSIEISEAFPLCSSVIPFLLLTSETCKTGSSQECACVSLCAHFLWLLWLRRWQERVLRTAFNSFLPALACLSVLVHINYQNKQTLTVPAFPWEWPIDSKIHPSLIHSLLSECVVCLCLCVCARVCYNYCIREVKAFSKSVVMWVHFLIFPGFTEFLLFTRNFRANFPYFVPDFSWEHWALISSTSRLTAGTGHTPKSKVTDPKAFIPTPRLEL